MTAEAATMPTKGHGLGADPVAVDDIEPSFNAASQASGIQSSPSAEPGLELPDGPESRPSRGKMLWRAAGKKVSAATALSNAFSTLRDQHQINSIATSELKTIRRLGEGAFAVVDECEYQPLAGGPMQVVAVKRLKPEILGNTEDVQCFLAEVALMRKLKHSNIVAYVGVGEEKATSGSGKETMFLVQEFVAGGTLKALIMKQLTLPHKSLYTLSDALRWCIQIADALAYMHAAKPKVIHRDLKLENVLLTMGATSKHQVAKLADFGLVALLRAHQQAAVQSSPPSLAMAADANDAARISLAVKAMEHRSSRKTLARALSSRAAPSKAAKSPAAGPTPTKWQTEGQVVSSGDGGSPVRAGGVALPTSVMLSGRTGTYMYMAPEMFQSKSYDERVDVFSFGVMVYEMVHKYMMVFAITLKGTEEEIEAYARKVSNGYRPPIRETLPESIKGVIRDAWAQEPNDRPSMEELLKRLKAIEESGEISAAEAATAGCGCTVS
mmetsp:Transcript_13051/g.37913  ORF Transcript_13051/g.37913 Transcript_13051/m.37913 type:complete len:497 (-) Transcript_13051:1501-2991(-)